MKKIISVVLAVLMLASLSLSSFATTISGDATNMAAQKTGETIVKTDTLKDVDGDGTGDENAESYTITFDAETKLFWETLSKDITYDVDAQLLWYNVLKVNVAGNDKMTFTTTGLLTDKTYEIPYALTGDTAVEDGPVVATTKTLNLAITLDAWNAVPVAEYSDTLTFTTSVVDARTNP